jgi:hypothetical protein
MDEATMFFQAVLEQEAPHNWIQDLQKNTEHLQKIV